MNLTGWEQIPLRMALLLGAFTRENTKMNPRAIPKKDLSTFALTKYKFLLEAPFEISSECCKVMKKGPAHEYYRRTKRCPITAQMAEESALRKQQWIKNGCNGFDLKYPVSNPMSFWTEQDVLLYIKMNEIEIASVYGDIVVDYDAMGEIEGQISFDDLFHEMGLGLGDSKPLKTTGCDRTGCMFCGYGCHLEKKPGRFEKMKVTHPKLYDYIMRPWEQEIEIYDPGTEKKEKVKLSGLNYKEVIDWLNEHGNLDIPY